jgi:cell surface hyaluronidase
MTYFSTLLKRSFLGLLILLVACSPALESSESVQAPQAVATETVASEASGPTEPLPTEPLINTSLTPYRAEVLQTPDPVLAPSRVTAKWSDAAFWPSGRLPKAGENVEIPKGETVLLDVSPPALGGVVINGALVFDDQDLNFSADWIMVHGRLEVGLPAKPYTHNAVITLTGKQGEDIMGMGNKFIGVMGGTLSLIGEERVVWTKLAKTAQKGDQTITLLDTVDWQAGDTIVVAPTDFDYRQAETFTVKSVVGETVTLNSTINYLHYGETQLYNGVTIDQRAEVGLLSRNIRIQGDEASEASGYGGHVMLMSGQALIDSSEFLRMGQAGQMGRYPVHWHRLGDEARGQYLRNSSIHNGFNRCVTIHASNGVKVQNNVAFNAPGHCVFLEDGAELDTIIENNLVLSVLIPEEGKAILSTDKDFPGPSAFWITHPQNVVRGNVAAGSAGSGFWYAFPAQPTGLSSGQTYWNRFSPLAEFSDNTAHSNSGDGLHVDNGPLANVEAGTEPTHYTPHLEPAAIKTRYQRDYNISALAPAVFENFVAYKNRHNGAWLRGEGLILQDPIFADNAVGATMAANNSVLRGGTFIGETANLGNTNDWEKVGPLGRSLPKPWECAPEICFDFPVRGFEFYDGAVGVENSYFAEFENNDVRKASALSYLQFTAFPISPRNYGSNLTFAPGTRRVHLASRGTPANPKDITEDGYRTAVFQDRDGSITGTPGSSVTVDTPFLSSGKCQKNNDWNALVCADKFVTFYLETDNPEIGNVTLSQANTRHTLYGVDRAPSSQFYGVVRSEQTYNVTLETTPREFRLGLGYTPGAWVRLSLNVESVSSVLQADRPLLAANSLADLEKVQVSSYYFDGDTLHFKLLSHPPTIPEDDAIRIKL